MKCYNVKNNISFIFATYIYQGKVTGHLLQVIPDLVALDGLLRLGVGLVGVVQSNLKLVDVTLQLLLDPVSKNVSYQKLAIFKRGRGLIV